MLSEPAASPAEIELFRSLLSRHAGMDCTRHGAAFLERRLLRRMTIAGARSLYEYYRLVAAPGGGELQALVDDVSVHETAFFRNAAQFEALRDTVLPALATQRARAGTRALRLWSAGCSTGQEVWSLAITLFECLPAHAAWSVQLLASDISSRALALARDGEYDPSQLAGLSAEQSRRFFESCAAGRRVRSFLRRGVEFQLGNVLEPPGGAFDVIFCRNVMIYFDHERQQQLLRTLSEALAVGGCLFLGQTEGLADAELPLDLVSTGRALYYRRRP